MKNIWFWYWEGGDMNGVAYAENRKEAKEKITKYIRSKFANTNYSLCKIKLLDEDICRVEKLDSFCDKCPDVVMIND